MFPIHVLTKPIRGNSGSLLNFQPEMFQQSEVLKSIHLFVFFSTKTVSFHECKQETDNVIK